MVVILSLSQAHRCALGADDAFRKGDLRGAMDLHLSAAKGFLRAAEQVGGGGLCMCVEVGMIALCMIDR